MKLFFYKNYQMISYLVAGALAVIINIIVFWLLSKTFLGIWLSNILAFLIAVLFSYWSNTRYVFQTKFTKKNFLQFWSMRISGLFFDMGSLYLLVRIGIDELLSKCIINLLITVFNFFCSKFYIYKKPKKGDSL